MQNKNILKADKIPQLLVICIVLIYGLLIAEFFSELNSKIFYAQPNFFHSSVFSHLTTFNYLLTIIMTFVVWIITSFLFHLFASLFNGDAQFKDFLKFTGLSYLLSAILFLIANFMFDNVEITQNDISDIFKTDRTARTISWLIDIAGYTYYLLVVPIIKYLYNINWLKSIGVIAIPMGSIFLLGQFFAKFIF